VLEKKKGSRIKIQILPQRPAGKSKEHVALQNYLNEMRRLY
jgi:hypothetical protein